MVVQATRQTALILFAITLAGAARAEESRKMFDEFTISCKGDGQLRVFQDERGDTQLQYQSNGGVRVANDQFEVQARQVSFDTSKRTLRLEGDVRLRLKEKATQSATGEVRADKILLTLSDGELSLESAGTNVIGKVRLRPLRQSADGD